MSNLQRLATSQLSQLFLLLSLLVGAQIISSSHFHDAETDQHHVETCTQCQLQQDTLQGSLATPIQLPHIQFTRVTYSKIPTVLIQRAPLLYFLRGPPTQA